VRTKALLVDYLESISGQHVELTEQQSTMLPLFLRDRFCIHSATMFGKVWLLALEHHLGKPVVLVLPSLESYSRNRLMKKNVAFIVPGRQVFLPMVFMDLRERTPGRRAGRQKSLTPTAQCLVLYHLQRGPVTEMPLQEVAKLIASSPMMVTNAKSELERAGFCSVIRRGRTQTLEFHHAARTLWEKALPLLSPPDRNRHWVTWRDPPRTALLAGISALSRRTLIQDDRIPTYAIWRRGHRRLIDDGTIVNCASREDASALLEEWSYPPLTLSVGETVDPLSLFLSLRDSPDERVQQQLQVLVDTVAW
jgi:hypothetical protein